MKSNSVIKSVLCTGLVMFVLFGCLTKARTRQFVVEEKALRKVVVGDWIVHAPQLRAFYKQAGVNEIPGLDTTLFKPLIFVEKPRRNELKETVVVDSAVVTFLETGVKFRLRTGGEQPTSTGHWDMEKYQYINFDKNNSIRIPMEVNIVLFEFEIRIENDDGETKRSEFLTYKMKRDEGSRIGFTYGD